ncbi:MULTISPECIES: indole-3-glycerol phosphate synthase TrpC [unclassified Streptomyces]|uniref:indole-3-glycerol phosphate synthase TrpC n=1 Tax=unclassified Streptomyces TaxID=2593676 RepID=UPI0024426B0A|nr:indole-3-glycerol phosphate synthase TrpC [Streptomyces sp. DH41]MDG9722056.1 indole-3-glycerol phosphate synthase TrpC [Streptomyces sp. DH41]
MAMHLDDIVAAKRAAWSGPAAADAAARGRSVPAVPGRFAAALGGRDVSVIAEIKPMSPSKGRLLDLSRAVPTAVRYVEAGASAVSVLGDAPYFGGSPELVRSVAEHPAVTVPVLFKDFLVDTRQVTLAHASGADAVLVIVRAVDDALLADLVATAHGLGLDALVETFTEDEVDRALDAGARVVGINNRDLRTFAVDLDNSARLRRDIPRGVLTVSESGLAGRPDIERIAAHGFDAALIGESLLSSPDPAARLRQYTGVPILEVAS